MCVKCTAFAFLISNRSFDQLFYNSVRIILWEQYLLSIIVLNVEYMYLIKNSSK